MKQWPSTALVVNDDHLIENEPIISKMKRVRIAACRLVTSFAGGQVTTTTATTNGEGGSR